MAGGRSFSDPSKAGATSFGMTSENFGYSAVRLKRVKKLQFGVVNPDELVSKLSYFETSRERRNAILYVSLSIG